MEVGSGVAVQAQKVLNFVLLRLLDITVLTPRIALKHQSDAFLTLKGQL